MEDKYISGIIAKYLANEANAEEQHLLLEWIAEDPLHQQVFLEYCNVWQEVNYPAPVFNDTIAFEKFKHIIYKEKSNNKYWQVIMAAACVAALLFVFSYFFVLLPPYSIQHANNTADTTSILRFAPPGKKITIKLADGSEIKLNSGSTIKIYQDFSKQRFVRLQGEAFFKIAHDTVRPFVVEANATKTTVLGTSFNVNTFDSVTQVTVASGKVLVQNELAHAFLLPNQQATIAHNQAQIKTTVTDASTITAWRNNILLFQNQTVHNVARQLERWYGVKIEVDETIAKKKISGKFINENMRTVLEAITYSIHASYTVNNSQVKIY
ncbi:MAG: FecR family protein [Chryseotalea sp.]|jgi:transmembrane sensor|nr:FecR domain-containing protein [Flammeovirgaceae bacterium]